jgi:AcrR family transcriptional regulator
VDQDSGRRSGGRPRRVKREDVRRRLLEAAYGVFSERGFEGASLERVAEAAGFSKGAVYSNFANKDELFYELMAARIDERTEAVRQAETRRAAGSRSQGDAARLAGRLLRQLGEADPEWQILFIEFWLRCARNEKLRERLAEKRRAMRAKIAAFIGSQATSSGVEIEHTQAMDLATTVLALSNGLGIEGIIDPKSVKPALFGELLACAVASGSVAGATVMVTRQRDLA